jgi:hypothetical protein
MSTSDGISRSRLNWRVGATVFITLALNLTAGFAVLCGWPKFVATADVNWLITFDIIDVHPHGTLWTTALASSQVSLLAIWCGARQGASSIRWLLLIFGILVWSMMLEFLHPDVAQAADSRAIFVLQSAMILFTMTCMRWVANSAPFWNSSKREVPRWALLELLGVTTLISIGLATSQFMQPNMYSSPITWQFSCWRLAVGTTCGAIALFAWWGSKHLWYGAPLAMILSGLAGSGLASAFARIELLWPPAHNPGEAHYSEVFWSFCWSYVLWAILQAGYLLLSLALVRCVLRKTENIVGTSEPQLAPT